MEKAIKWADSYSRNKIIIVEEFIQRGFPYVIGGDIFVWDGKIVLFGEMSCLRGEGGNGLIPIGEKTFMLQSSEIQEVHNELQRLVTLLGIQVGELNIEMLIDKNGKAHFLELGPRAGGNMIPLQLSDAFGVNLVKANVLAAMGEDPQLELNEQVGCFMTYVLHSYTDGKFSGVHYSPAIEPYVYRREVYKKEGDFVEAFDGAGKACGIVFIHFDNVDQMQLYADNMENLITVELQ